jgi:hypothetical protein
MHFRDGNDPAKAPGATRIYPDDAANIFYDSANDVVINSANGERMTFRRTGREDYTFDAAVMNNPQSPIIIHGYFGAYDEPGFEPALAYNITHIRISSDNGAQPADYPIEQVASFLQKFPNPYVSAPRSRRVVVIDNHSNTA